MIFKWLRRRPNVIAFALLSIGVLAAIIQQQEAAQERKQQICYAEIEDRLLLRDLLAFFLGEAKTPGEDPRLTEYRDYAFTLLDIPPTICEGTGITTQDVREDHPENPVAEAARVIRTITYEEVRRVFDPQLACAATGQGQGGDLGDLGRSQDVRLDPPVGRRGCAVGSRP